MQLIRNIKYLELHFNIISLLKLQNHIKNLQISKIKVTASVSTFDTLHDVRQMAQLWIEPYVRVRNNFQRTHLVQSTRLCYCLWGYCNLVLNTFKVKSTTFFFLLHFHTLQSIHTNVVFYLGMSTSTWVLDYQWIIPITD